jgi:hypothetical protein
MKNSPATDTGTPLTHRRKDMLELHECAGSLEAETRWEPEDPESDGCPGWGNATCLEDEFGPMDEQNSDFFEF